MFFILDEQCVLVSCENTLQNVEKNETKKKERKKIIVYVHLYAMRSLQNEVILNIISTAISFFSIHSNISLFRSTNQLVCWIINKRWHGAITPVPTTVKRRKKNEEKHQSLWPLVHMSFQVDRLPFLYYFSPPSIHPWTFGKFIALHDKRMQENHLERRVK